MSSLNPIQHTIATSATSPESVAMVKRQILATQKIVLKYFLPQQGDAQEQAKFRKYVLDPNTHLNMLPMVPYDLVFSAHVCVYLKSLREEGSLDDRNNLANLWTLDVLRKINFLKKIPTTNFLPEDIDALMHEFAALSLRFALIHSESKIEYSLHNDSTQFNITIYSIGQYTQVLNQFGNRIEAFRFKASAQKDKAIFALQHLTKPELIQRFKEKRDSESKIESILKSVLCELTIGISLLNDPYYRNYLYEITLGHLIPKPVCSQRLSDIQEQFNLYIDMVQSSWRVIGERKWATLVPQTMLSLSTLKLETDREESLLSALDFRREIGTRMTTLFPQMDRLKAYCALNKSIQHRWRLLFSPEKTAQDEQGKPGIESNEEILISHAWLLEATACFIKANHDLVNIQRVFDELICKKTLPHFYTFNTLSNRLHTNMIRSLGAIHTSGVELVEFKSAYKGSIAEFLADFDHSLSSIVMDLEKMIHDSLPDPLTCANIVKQYSWICKEFEGFNSLPILASYFQPFKKAVVNAVVKVQPAIKQAHKLLLDRSTSFLETIDSSILERERNGLAESLETLRFTKMKNFLEMLVTLKDIQVVLLSPEEGSEALEKGGHLIPIELVDFLDGESFVQLIDAQIQCGSAAKPMGKMVKINSLSGFVERDHSSGAGIPPIEYSSDSRVLEILDYLQDSRSFKIVPGEKEEITCQRLLRLGVEVLRWKGSTHCSLGHFNTDTTFSFPVVEKLSAKEAEELAKWVNHHVL